MSTDGDASLRPQRFGHHANAFGFLRLLFASLVIIYHVPLCLDDDFSRRVQAGFDRISFGELAVDGFFILSGYLILGSYLNRASTLSYLKKRALRIYPGYFVATLACVTVVAPLAGAGVTEILPQLPKVVIKAMLLELPDVGPVFDGTPFPSLNGSMWTIPYEFRCYLMIIVLGLCGLFRRRGLLLLFTLAVLTLAAVLPEPLRASSASGPNVLPAHARGLAELVASHVAPRLGDLRPSLRLVGCFLAGSCFYAFSDVIVFRVGYLLGSFLLFCAGLFWHASVTPAAAVFGGYALFAFATLNARTALSKVNNKTDISYGVYLYGWPVGKLVLWFLPGANLILAVAASLILSYGLGWLSWIFVERPAMAMLRRSAQRNNGQPGDAWYIRWRRRAAAGHEPGAL